MLKGFTTVEDSLAIERYIRAGSLDGIRGEQRLEGILECTVVPQHSSSRRCSFDSFRFATGLVHFIWEQDSFFLLLPNFYTIYSPCPSVNFALLRCSKGKVKADN